MQKITLIVILFISVAASAQTFEWIQSPSIDHNVNNGSSSYPVTTDSSGNVYTAGFKDQPYFYTDLLGRVQLQKYNSEGETQYSKLIDGRVIVYDIKTDTDGNLIMIAGFNQSISLDSFELVTPDQGMKFIVLKLDSQGALVWHLALGSEDAPSISHLYGLDIDNANNVYVGYDNFMDSFITKVSPLGTQLLTIEQNEVNMITSVSIDDAGNIYSAGSCASIDAAFAGVNIPTTFNYNTYVAKYSAAGIFQWMRYVDDITCAKPNVKAYSPEAVYFSSYLSGSYDFDAIVTEGPVQNFDDFFLAKLDSSGNFQWVREVIGSGRISIGNQNFLDLDSSGNIYFTGATSGATNWGNSLTTNSVGFGNTDGLILKYNPDGDVQMAKTVANAGFDSFDGIAVNAWGDIYISGLMGAGTSNFDGIPFTVNQYDYSPILAKVSPSVLGIPSAAQKKITVYPNPSFDFIHFSDTSNVTGSIYNSVGQKIMDLQIVNNQPISISKLAKGAYIIRLDGHTPMKLIKS